MSSSSSVTKAKRARLRDEALKAKMNKKVAKFMLQEVVKQEKEKKKAQKAQLEIHRNIWKSCLSPKGSKTCVFFATPNQK